MRVSRPFRPLLSVLVLALVGAGLLAPAAGAWRFTEGLLYDTGLSPRGIAAGDFNGDGRHDVVTADADADTISVLLGDGSGDMGARRAFATGARPCGVTVGDFDGDGRQDVATADATDSTVSVLLGDGSGGFAAAAHFATGSSPNGIALGDFNGDGDQDLVTANSGTLGVSVLLGDGSGGFGPATGYATGGGTRSVAVADFNGDGDQDLVTADYTAGTATVLLGTGDGSFGAGSQFEVGAGPSGVAAGDFNADGRQDFATANTLADTMSVRFGDGAGGFGAPVSLQAFIQPGAALAGDFNGDGVQDLAGAGGFGIYVYLSDGAGDFDVRVEPLSDFVSVSICARDFNGDGALDLAMAQNFGSDGWVFLGFYQTAHGTMRLSGGAAATATRAVTVDAGVAEATQMRVRNVGEGWSEWAESLHRAPWTLPAGDGLKTVEAQYRNSLGATEVLSDTILLDTTAPGTTDDVAGRWMTSSPATVTLKPDDGSGSGVAKTQHKVDGAASWSEGTSVPVAGDGLHTLRYRSVDAVGNVEETQVVLVRVDTRGPVTSGQPVSARKGRRTKFKVLVSDPLCAGATTGATVVIKSRAGKTLRTLPATPVAIGAQATVTWARCRLKPGTYKYVVLARDAAGNQQRKAGGARLVVR